MSQITATTVKELRDLTGLGMMECKKALQETGGSIKEAEDLLRIKRGSKASKVSGRIAAEGAISVHLDTEGKVGALVEVNCETDFVGKDKNFKNFVESTAKVAVQERVNSVEGLSDRSIQGETIESIRQSLVMKLGENMSIRRVALVEAVGTLGYYIHGGRIGVLVDFEGGDAELGKDLAMHVAAMKPLAVSGEQISKDIIDREKQIARERALDAGKPEQIVDKIVEGTVRKYLAEVTLLGQTFVKNDKQTIQELLKSKEAKVHGFNMFIVGEGIEKKATDFVAEVEAQASKVQ